MINGEYYEPGMAKAIEKALGYLTNSAPCRVIEGNTGIRITKDNYIKQVERNISYLRPGDFYQYDYPMFNYDGEDRTYFVSQAETATILVGVVSEEPIDEAKLVGVDYLANALDHIRIRTQSCVEDSEWENEIVIARLWDPITACPDNRTHAGFSGQANSIPLAVIPPLTKTKINVYLADMNVAFFEALEAVDIDAINFGMKVVYVTESPLDYLPRLVCEEVPGAEEAGEGGFWSL